MVDIKKRLIAQCLLGTYLIVMLLVSGCADRYGRVLRPGNEHREISKTHSEFSVLANSSDLPVKYVSEGKIGVSKVEAALEAADTADVQARAEWSKQLADFSARRREMEAQVNIDLSEAEALRERSNKEYGKAMAQIAAREAEVDALVGRKDAIVASLVQEGNSKRNDIIADASEKFESETARIEQLKEIHNAIKVEGNASILEMTEASKATRERASATVLELEAKARAVQQETKARVDELDEQIKSATIQTKSEADRLNVSREAILKDAAAHVKELRTKAATIQANLADEEYQLKLAEAVSVKAEAHAKTQEKSANAPTRFDKAMAEIDRLRAEVRHHQESSEASYESSTAEIEAKLDDELNEIKKVRISSDRGEEVARAEFVKAEAAARAEAVRQTAIHAEAVAEAQKLQIIAEAEAEAARIKQEVLDEIASKKAAKKVEIDDNTTVAPLESEEMFEVPDVPQVEAVAPRIEPNHIAVYRTSFAEVMRSRAQADAHELVAEATFAEAKTNLLAVKRQEDAIAAEQLAISDALESQARTRFSEIETKTEKEMDVTDSKYRQQLVQAESFRKEKEAEVLDYQSQANALEQIANARAEQLLAESEAVTKCGENDVQELKVGLWAVQQRGDAQYSRLMTEAHSITDSQEALALQIDAQIDSARRCLGAELATIQNSIQAATRIAQADYQQALTQATVLRQRIEAEISRTNAQFAMEHTISKAQIGRDRKLALSQSLRSEAACDRMVADASTSKMCENANLDAKHASVEADMDIILAGNSAKRDAARAYLDAVKARFSARIEQVKAERVIEVAGEHNAVAMRRTDLAAALAEATAAREDSNRKLAELQKRQSELQVASMVNWSDKLAMFKNQSTEFKAAELDVPSTPLAEMPVAEGSPVTYTVNTWSPGEAE
ncbi:MAG: coiled-coil domain-containing protein [Planctomycetota bacterium]